MSKRIFSPDQIFGLAKNRYVAKCSEKSITYSKEFKILALKRYSDGLSPTQIFQEAGFDVNTIGKNIPNDRLTCWWRVFRNTGLEGLRIETRGRGKGGGRPRTKGLTEADRIKRLEIEVAYLKAENNFLAKLRAAKKR
jgi:transposase-like protein